MWDLPIIATDELENYKVDLVVIIARPSVIQIIYKRINDACSRLDIPAYDINGNRIELEKELIVEDIDYFHINADNLRDAINKHKVISFDIYDTLLMRKVLYPTDVYLVVEEKIKNEIDFSFSTIRKEAEQNIKKECVPNICQIYDEIVRLTGISKEQAERIKTVEIETELAVTTPRREMCEIFDSCKELGKEVVILSDMYFDTEILGRILSENGINGYDRLIISCEYNRTKFSGLAEELLKIYSSGDILHIGDNDKSDISAVAALGIDTFRVMSANDMLDVSYAKAVLDYSDNLYRRTLIAKFAASVFNSPFALFESKGRIKAEDYEQLTTFIFPMIIAQMFWMTDHIAQDASKVSDVVFVARDGYIPIRMYKKIREWYNLSSIPAGKYVLMSGRATTMACIEDADEIKPKLQEFKGSKEELYKNIFDLDLSEGEVDDSRIVELCQKERKEYLKYLDSLDIDISGKVYYQDFFSKGTGQDNLGNLLGIDLTGCYLNKASSGIERRNQLDCISFFEAANHYVKNFNIFKFYSLIEYIYSAPFPCLKKLINNEPVYFPEDRTESGYEFMTKMQQASLDYLDDFLN